MTTDDPLREIFEKHDEDIGKSFRERLQEQARELTAELARELVLIHGSMPWESPYDR